MRPAEVEIAIFEPSVFVGLGLVIDIKRRHLRGVEQAKLSADKFHLARREIGIDRFRRPLGQDAAHGDHIFGANLPCLLMGQRINFRIEDDLA